MITSARSPTYDFYHSYQRVIEKNRIIERTRRKIDYWGKTDKTEGTKDKKEL